MENNPLNEFFDGIAGHSTNNKYVLEYEDLMEHLRLKSILDVSINSPLVSYKQFEKASKERIAFYASMSLKYEYDLNGASAINDDGEFWARPLPKKRIEATHYIEVWSKSGETHYTSLFPIELLDGILASNVCKGMYANYVSTIAIWKIRFKAGVIANRS